jgi:molybdopterin/thiamine biosynthesis adenylyltransferase
MAETTVRPRVKSIHPVYKLRPGLFRIGAQIGITRQFVDPREQLWDLVGLMDGTRDVPQLAAALAERHPTLTEADVREGLRRLDEAGLLEGADASPYDEEGAAPHRWVANVSYFSHFQRMEDRRGEHQDRLARARVTLLGLGGAGSTVLKLLLGMGVGDITAVDYDRVELSNLNRQFFYREKDVGKLKTEAAREVVAEMSSGAAFRAVERRIDSYRDVVDLAEGRDLLISTIDEPQFLALRRVNKGAVVAGTTALFAAMQVTRGRVFTVVPGETGCFDCLHLYYHKNDALFVDQFRGFHSAKFVAPHLAFAPNVFLLCGRMATEAARLLTGYSPPTTLGQQAEIDFETGETRTLMSWPRYDECPTCGTGVESDWPAFTYYDAPV